jgi:hypothetical protein
MNLDLITCSLCGHSFRPSEHPACPSCPLKPRCQLVCCPNCGFEMVDVNQSRLAQLFSSLLKKSKNPDALGSDGKP